MLKVEGELVGDGVDVLKGEYSALVRDGCLVRLDLVDVTYIDGKGLRLLRGLVRSGVGFANCTSVVADMLAEEEVG
jgi:hypothetical protein